MHKQVQLVITAFNDKGYGVGQVDGKDIWCLGVLPGEEVTVSIYKKRKGVFLAKLEQIHQASIYRVSPRDEAYTSTSPWQILRFDREIYEKQTLVKNYFRQFGLDLPDCDLLQEEPQWQYRNKVEYSFYGSENQLSLAFHMRGSTKGKVPVQSSSLMPTTVNQAANQTCLWLQEKGFQARDLKTVLLRCDQQGRVALQVYTKLEQTHIQASDLESILSPQVLGVEIVYSNPKSPASVYDHSLLKLGRLDLEDQIDHMRFTYPVHGFFQVNLPLFAKAVQDIRLWFDQHSFSGSTLVDMYAGVGVLGQLLADQFDKVTAVEIFPGSTTYALENARLNGLTDKYTFLELPAEQALDTLNSEDIVLLDPPRSGLHPKVVQKLLQTSPPVIIYLSCNPKTQAADISQLVQSYDLDFYRLYNFYPKTPHVEGLAILKRKS